MPSVIVIGGGLSGLAAAAALGGAGYDVNLYESRGFLGGRATSYPLPGSSDSSEIIDNCQHVLLRCCTNLLDLYKRLNVQNDITFHREFFFLEPGGHLSTLKAGILPSPLHFSGSFLRMRCLGLADKVALAKAMLALKRERTTRKDLDRITMADWLAEKRQPVRLIERFWKQVLVSAINEDLDRMAAIHGFQVMWLGFLATGRGYEMGIPNVPLGALYASDAWQRFPNVRIHLRKPVERLDENGVLVDGALRKADYYISCVPFERLGTLQPDIPVPQMEHSPITGIHLWFDRPVTNLPHAVLLDRTIQWMFNKEGGRYLQFVVSASRSLLNQSRNEVIELALREAAEFFPETRHAQLLKAHVVKEVRATFSARPGLESERPTSRTSHPKIFLAGDWTRSGWPATMEGAVRSGYLAAEAITGAPFLKPDL